jgi:ABC-type uncharacterized transport system permease subunit
MATTIAVATPLTLGALSALVRTGRWINIGIEGDARCGLFRLAGMHLRSSAHLGLAKPGGGGSRRIVSGGFFALLQRTVDHQSGSTIGGP